MYNNPFINNANNQANIDRINNQINELQRLRDQIQHPTPPPTNLTQNFQLAPTNKETIRYADSMEEVKRDVAYGTTPYFSKDMSVAWIKNAQGEIKTYELVEIVPKDEKDIKIEYLQAQIEELKKEMRNNESDSTIDGATSKSVESEKPTNVSTISKPTKKSK